MTDAIRSLVVGAAALGLTFAWLAIHTVRTDATAPDRLVLELRLAQFAALLLVLIAGVYVGFAIVADLASNAGWDVALAIGFLVLASMATTWDPRQALTALTLAFAAHAGIDLLHTIDMLPSEMAPRWYFTACAIYDVVIAGLCYLPILRR